MDTLNQNQLEALRILWERGESKPADIQAEFSWPIENATLRSVLVNLAEKQHVARRLQGKTFYYSAKAPKGTLLQGMARMLARVFAGGSHKELVAQLLETGDLKPSDLRNISEIAAGKRNSNRKAK